MVVGFFLGFMIGAFVLPNLAGNNGVSESLEGASIAFTDLSLDAFDTSTFVSELTQFKKFKFTLTYNVTGGETSLSFRNVSLQVKLEDVLIGTVSINDFLYPSGSEIKTETFILDATGTPNNDIDYILNYFGGYNEEIKVSIEGSVIINGTTSSKSVFPSITEFFLLGSPSITVNEASWDKAEVRTGDTAIFTVELENNYRKSPISGNLQVDVLEDRYGDWMGVKLAKSYTFSLDFNYGESKIVSDSYVAGQYYDIRGFFIKVYWQGQLVYQMPQTYPPALDYLFS